MGVADQGGGPWRTLCGQWPEERGQGGQVGRCWVLAPADLPSRALPGEGGDHCVPKLPAGPLLLKGDPSP